MAPEFETGIALGRFQPFHLDHLAYVRAAKARCRRLVIGITNPDPHVTAPDAADPNRSAAAANPLSYYDRLTLVRDALRGDGWPADAFDIVPLPINRPDLIPGYVPEGAAFFLTIYDAWGRKKADILRAQGYPVVVLWERPPELKGLSAGAIRDAIRTGRPWAHHLPPGALPAFHRLGLVDKIRRAGGPELREP
jgi:nicotinamide-nucleotide adenylyltransferase